MSRVAIYAWDPQGTTRLGTHPFLTHGRHTEAYCQAMATASGRESGRFVVIEVARGTAGTVDLRDDGADVVLGVYMVDGSMAWIRPPTTLFRPTGTATLPLSRPLADVDVAAVQRADPSPVLLCYRTEYDLMPWWWPLGPGGEDARPWQRVAVLAQVLNGQPAL